MSKMKKVLLMCTAYVLVAALAIGGTIAYLTSTDSDVNVMTLGNVKIEQHEYERVIDANGSYEKINVTKADGSTQESYKLQEFSQAKPLYPAVGNTTGYDPTYVRFEQLGNPANVQGGQQFLSGVKNAQDKIVLVENTGKTDAYVRTIFAFEMGTLTSIDEWHEVVKDCTGNNGEPWKYTYTSVINIDGNNYAVMEAIYTGYSYGNMRHNGGILPAGEWTYNSLAEVYMSSEATNEDVEAIDGNKNGTYDILVLSQAVQVAGFADAKTALDTGFGKTADKAAEWFKGVIYEANNDTWDGTVDTSWYNDTGVEFELTEAEQLAGLAELVNGGNTFAGKTVKLARNLNLMNIEWTPIGVSEAFSGTFDGQNHTISNMTITKQNQYIGLFGFVNNAVIKNLTVENASITAVGSSVFAAAIVGYHTQADGVATTLDNVTVNNATIDAKAAATYVGGIFGYCSKGNMTVTDSTVNGLKITSNATGGKGNVGGLIGYTYKVDPLKVENVNITGLDIDFVGKGESYTGGVTGRDESISRDNGGYKNVFVSGTIDENISSGSGSSVGGFVGISYQYPHTYAGCTADVDVSGGNRAGGFVGTVAINAWAGQTDTYNDCTAKGDVCGPYAGGFVGCAWLNASANSTLLLNGVKAEGTVSATNQGGGLIGSAWGSNNACSNIIIRDSVAAQTVTGPQVGGVVGAHSMGKGKTITLENVTSYITPEIR